jgi:ribA/ribD-fused uncharacterized protein
MKIENFSGKYEFLSNFSPSPVVWDGRIWETVEHLYQARKTKNRGEQEKIRNAPTPGKAKRLGRKVSSRDDWEKVKRNIMLDCVRLKFNSSDLLTNKLADTSPQKLVEGNSWHDNTWGNCDCSKCKNTRGENLLGKILMQVREEISGL